MARFLCAWWRDCRMKDRRGHDWQNCACLCSINELVWQCYVQPLQNLRIRTKSMCSNLIMSVREQYFMQLFYTTKKSLLFQLCHLTGFSGDIIDLSNQNHLFVFPQVPELISVLLCCCTPCHPASVAWCSAATCVAWWVTPSAAFDWTVFCLLSRNIYSA